MKSPRLRQEFIKKDRGPVKIVLVLLANLTLYFPAFSQEANASLYHEARLGEEEIQVTIHTGLFLPALEQAISADGSVKIDSLAIDGDPIKSDDATVTYQFPLSFELSTEGKNYDLSCDLNLIDTKEAVFILMVENCTRRASLAWPKSWLVDEELKSIFKSKVLTLYGLLEGHLENDEVVVGLTRTSEEIPRRTLHIYQN